MMFGESGQETETVKKKVRWPIFLAGVLLVAAGIVILLIAINGSGASSSALKDQLELAERYLSELDYEKAVAAYKKAIEIDPKCEEAYTGLAGAAEKLADGYIAEGKEEKAEKLLEEVAEILEDGYEETRAEAVKERRTWIGEKRTRLKALKDRDQAADADDDNSGNGDADAEAATPTPAEEGALAQVEFEWDISTVTVFDSVYDGGLPEVEANECDLNVALEADPSLTKMSAAGGTEYRDGSGKLILEEKTEQKGNKKVYSCKVYSLKYDFSVMAEPVTYVFGVPDYPLAATISYSDGRKTTYTAEEMQCRSYTGTWFFGICSNANGQLGAYQGR